MRLKLAIFALVSCSRLLVLAQQGEELPGGGGTSPSYPVHHVAALSATWHPEHSQWISSAWPANHFYLVSTNWPLPPNGANDPKVETSYSWPAGHESNFSASYPYPTHSTQTSEFWGPNHLLAASQTFPPAHGVADSRAWAPSHIQALSSVPGPHPHHTFYSGSIGNYPLGPGPAHTVETSASHPNHEYYFSAQFPWPFPGNWPPNHIAHASQSFPQPPIHQSGLSSAWPPSHHYLVSETWPPASVPAWPPNHAQAVSNTWGP